MNRLLYLPTNVGMWGGAIWGAINYGSLPYFFFGMILGAIIGFMVTATIMLVTDK